MNEVIKQKRYKPSKFMKAYWRYCNWFRDNIFEPVWYRFFGYKHHIIKTGLKPRSWIDVESRMLYGVMELVKWFVENDMRIWTKEEREEEFNRMKEDLEYGEDHSKAFRHQLERDDKIVEIYRWWKNYPKRQEEISKALNDWYKYAMSFKEDPEDGLFAFNEDKPMTEEEKAKREELQQRLWKLEEDLKREEGEYLKMAVDLREYMWS